MRSICRSKFYRALANCQRQHKGVVSKCKICKSALQPRDHKQEQLYFSSNTPATSKVLGTWEHMGHSALPICRYSCTQSRVACNQSYYTENCRISCTQFKIACNQSYYTENCRISCTHFTIGVQSVVLHRKL